jgi:hypothetical protein
MPLIDLFFKEARFMRRFQAALGLLCCSAVSGAAEFAEPVRLKAGDKAIKVEAPGYAFPCWADVDGDGKKELLVGQFRGGKMKVFKHLGDYKFAEGSWLEVDGKPAEVPGVW